MLDCYSLFILKMANNSPLKKHQQFGIKLLLIAVIVGVTFTVWYWSEKKQPGSDAMVEHQQNQIPGNDLSANKAKYAELAKKIVTSDYEDIILAENFHLISEGKALNASDAKQFWMDFRKQWGEVKPESVKMETLGNQVKISYQTTNLQFRRVLAFGNYKSPQIQPSLLRDFVEAAPVGSKQNLLVGQTLPAGMIVETYMDGKISKTDITKSKNWKIIVFYPADFTFVCPTECIALRDDFKKFDDMKVDVYGASIDLPETHQAWEEMYLGMLPYPLISDYDKVLARTFGFWSEKEGVTLRGTVIISPDNEIRFMSAQSNDTGRNVDEYLRLIKAFQTPGLKPVNWHEGEKTL